MKFLLSSLALLLFLGAFPQDQDADSIQYYFSKGQSAKALSIAKKSYSNINSIAESETYITAASWFARIHFGMAQFDSALNYYLKASAAAKRKFGETSGEYGQLLTGVATTYMQSGQYEEAGQQFQSALDI